MTFLRRTDTHTCVFATRLPFGALPCRAYQCDRRYVRAEVPSHKGFYS